MKTHKKLTAAGIINLLRKHKETLSKYRVKRIGLFGSYLHPNTSHRRDIDLLIEFDQVSFDNYMDLKLFLERLFNRKVDLVMSDVLKPRLRTYILSEVKYA